MSNNRLSLNRDKHPGVINKSLYQNNWVILFPILFLLILVMHHNSKSNPNYESKFSFQYLDKFDRVNPQNQLQDQLEKITQMEVQPGMIFYQNKGQINTTTQELSINILVSKVMEQDGTVTIIKLPKPRYQHNSKLAIKNNQRPNFQRSSLKSKIIKSSLSSIKTSQNSFDVKQSEKNIQLLNDSQNIKSRLNDIDVAKAFQKPKEANSLFNEFDFLGLLILGLSTGIIGTFFSKLKNNKIKNIRDIERNSTFPIFSIFPTYEENIKEIIRDSPKLEEKFVSLIEGKYVYKETFKNLEATLTAKIKSKPKIIMVTSCEEKAGKTEIATNLAITSASSNKKTLLIDCNIKNPNIAKKFELRKYSSGLIDYLSERTETPNIYKPIKFIENRNILMNLFILPTGAYTDISGKILASERMKKLLGDLEYYDFVIIDSPSLLSISDTISLGKLVNNYILVIRYGKTLKENIKRVISEMQPNKFNFQGLVINNYNA